MSSPLFCLADAAPGDCVAVTHLVFDNLRFLYPTRGFAPGDELRCIGFSANCMRFETVLGGTVSIDRFYACFLRVERTEGHSFPTWSLTHRRVRSLAPTHRRTMWRPRSSGGVGP